MIIGLLKETKLDEYRVALLPVGTEELTRAGHRVLVQKGAGAGSGLTDEVYAENGAILCDTAAEVWGQADLIIKVKEPLPAEWPLLRRGQIVFTYFHFAASEALTKAVVESGITSNCFRACVAFGNHHWGIPKQR